MNFPVSLIAKLLTAVAVLPAAGYGGYCAYDHFHPTLHNQITRKGFGYFPINDIWGEYEDDVQKPDEIFGRLGGDWRCSKHLFGDITTPSVDTSGYENKSDLTIPNVSSVTGETPETNSIGCLVVDLGHANANTSKKAGFLKWELALKSGDKGFIYVGFFSAGNVKEYANKTIKQQSHSIVFEVRKTENEWDIKQGLNWADYFADIGSSEESTLSNLEINIVFPNGYKWNSKESVCSLDDEINKCPDKEQWTFKKYVGFWEEGTGDKHVVDAIKIETIKDARTYKHDIWSNKDFDFSSSEVVSDGSPVWASDVTRVYSTTERKWGVPQDSSRNAQDYLVKIYKPWAKKKGSWTESKQLCAEAGNRGVNDEGAERLIKFCYKK